MALTSGELLCSPAGVIGLIGFELVILLVTLTGAGTGLRSFSIVATGTCTVGGFRKLFSSGSRNFDLPFSPASADCWLTLRLLALLLLLVVCCCSGGAIEHAIVVGVVVSVVVVVLVGGAGTVAVVVVVASVSVRMVGRTVAVSTSSVWTFRVGTFASFCGLACSCTDRFRMSAGSRYRCGWEMVHSVTGEVGELVGSFAVLPSWPIITVGAAAVGATTVLPISGTVLSNFSVNRFGTLLQFRSMFIRFGRFD